MAGGGGRVRGRVRTMRRCSQAVYISAVEPSVPMRSMVSSDGTHGVGRPMAERKVAEKSSEPTTEKFCSVAHVRSTRCCVISSAWRSSSSERSLSWFASNWAILMSMRTRDSPPARASVA